MWALYPNVNNSAYPYPFDPLDTLQIAWLLRIDWDQRFQAEAVTDDAAFDLPDCLDLIDLHLRPRDLDGPNITTLADADNRYHFGGFIPARPRRSSDLVQAVINWTLKLFDQNANSGALQDSAQDVGVNDSSGQSGAQKCSRQAGGDNFRVECVCFHDGFSFDPITADSYPTRKNSSLVPQKYLTHELKPFGT